MPLVNAQRRCNKFVPLKKSIDLRLPSESDAMALSKMELPAAYELPLVGRNQAATGAALVTGGLVDVTVITTGADVPSAPALSNACARNTCIPATAFDQLKL